LARGDYAGVDQSNMRVKSFQPWKRAFLWSDVRSENDIFAASDSAHAIDEALDFFVSSVASASGANHTRLRVAEPVHDAGCVEVPIRNENAVVHEPAGHVG
jgi:hypothetical protein